MMNLTRAEAAEFLKEQDNFAGSDAAAGTSAAGIIGAAVVLAVVILGVKLSKKAVRRRGSSAQSH